jgi:ribosomal protein S18 acetylase RimI-like enzyme
MNIQKNWNTNRLLIREAVSEDIAELERICVAWDNKLLLEGENFPENYIKDCITKGDLPPVSNADLSNYAFRVLQENDGRIIGFFDVYHGYPDDKTAWISTFLIDKEIQGRSYGKEVVESIYGQCKKAGWKSIGLGVHLKNWIALRFWTKNGFNIITGIYGDKEYSESAFSIIALKKELV